MVGFAFLEAVTPILVSLRQQAVISGSLLQPPFYIALVPLSGDLDSGFSFR